MKHLLPIWSMFLLLCTAGTTWAQGTLPYVDIHINSSLKAYNSRSTNSYNLWEQIDHQCGPTVSNLILSNYGEDLIKYSQAHFEALARGNTRIVGLALSPVETQTLNSRFLTDENKKATISCLTGIVANQLFLRKTERDYFSDLVGNIEFIRRFEGEKYYINGFNYYFNIIRSVEDLDATIADPDRIGILLTIEGGHALGHSIYIDEQITETLEYESLIEKNINRLKGLLPISDNTDEVLDAPILYLSLARTYENGMGGQAQSLSKMQQYLFGRSPTVGEGPSELGKRVIKLLLSRERGGRRILIDIKHMSLEFRKWYYKYIDRLRILGDNVPVVASHCGISGLSWDDDLYLRPDDDNKNSDNYLNHWKQNLSKEDIQFIAKSGGIIGISLDKSVLCGTKSLDKINQTIRGTIQKRDAIIEVIMANILTVVKTVGNEKGWDIISIGSDYDAMLSPMTTYLSAEQIPDLARDIQRFLESPQPIDNLFTVKEIRSLMFNMKPDEITKKIMSENALNFIRNNLPQ